MDRTTFWHLHDLISDDPTFYPSASGGRPQRPITYQLATFLCRVGAENALKTASIMAIAEGTVYLYTERVCMAFHRLRSRFLAWPGPVRRQQLSDAMNEWGFPGCIGIGDGSYIRLQDKPLRNPFAYYCRKKFHAVSYCYSTFLTRYDIHATCDHHAMFTSYEFDSRVFRNSHMWRNRAEYFNPHEYILVDKGKYSEP
ncbi:hypothetical protein BDR07DRAFT_1449849 [Suillus spraguei]|nr:hypothetical protein BDR07DRAFT_1449849 [Suillus spraguei]